MLIVVITKLLQNIKKYKLCTHIICICIKKVSFSNDIIILYVLYIINIACVFIKIYIHIVYTLYLDVTSIYTYVITVVLVYTMCIIIISA